VLTVLAVVAPVAVVAVVAAVVAVVAAVMAAVAAAVTAAAMVGAADQARSFLGTEGTLNRQVQNHNACHDKVPLLLKGDMSLVVDFRVAHPALPCWVAA
jgi:hypothetical protein